MNDKFIKCKCGSEMLALSAWEDERIMYISIWSYGDRYKLSLRDRIYWAWKVLTTGRSTTDQMVLGHYEMIILKNFIIQEFDRWTAQDKKENSND